MAQNDVVLLDSLLSKAKSRLTQARDASELFELFVFEQLLKDYDLSYEEIETGWVDGPDDGGIDGFFVFVDGIPASGDDFARGARWNPNLEVVLVSAKRSATFSQQPVNSLMTSFADLFDLRKDVDDLEYPFNEDVLTQREVFRELYISLADRRPSLSVRVHFCTRGDTSKLPRNISTRYSQFKTEIEALFSEITAEVIPYGAAELLEKARKKKTFSLKLRFVENYISRESTNYVVLATLSNYFKFISDEQGGLRRYLFESNVRDYLGEVQINRDIKHTLAERSRADERDFWWFNNGVTLLATHATVVGKDLNLENVQIVNGLQTTEAIHQFFSQQPRHDDDRAILIKVILATDETVRDRIIKATNYQNTVDLASLRGLDKIQRDIEHFLSDHNWFYDRRKNFYKNQGKPADRIVSIPYLASAVRAIALGDPAGSRRQRSRSLREDEKYNAVFNPSWDLRVYLVSLEITRAIEDQLHPRRSSNPSPPIALVHYVGYAFVCQQLGKKEYRPEEITDLEGRVPLRTEVIDIEECLFSGLPKNMSLKGKKRKLRDLVLKPDYMEQFFAASAKRDRTHDESV